MKTITELRVIEYALVMLLSNWDDITIDDMEGITTEEEVETLLRRYEEAIEEELAR